MMRQKGLTLIELLVAMAVGGVIMVGALGVTFRVAWDTNRGNSQVVQISSQEWADCDIMYV